VIKVLVADDHAVVRRGLRQILSETRDIVVGGEAQNANELMEKIRGERWDVVVLDINFGTASGLELLKDIVRDRPGLPVVILTVFAEAQYAVRALRSGAAGFLNKETAPDLLIAAVRKVAEGGRYVTPELAEHLATFVAKGEQAAHEALSNRELQVLTMIGSGKTVSEIARELSLSVKTVSTHRVRILAKMGMRTNAELTAYAIKNALV
jgi:two-component system invasion response regulator UvrY